MRNRKKGFTLIELIAVLVILAVIAVIVTPLVLNIVNKAKDSANKRSVDAYGKALELAVATYLLDTEDYPTTIDDLTVEYTGNEVVCNVKTLNEDGSIYLSECTVKGTEVKDSKTEDGWYHYGKTTSKEVTYETYNIGDTVTYNDMEFYVITPSDETSESVTLLKTEPLTVDEVNTYGAGHINNYTSSIQGTSGNYGSYGYGGMTYYSRATCGFVDGTYVGDGCTTDYGLSDVKYVVDAWATDKFTTSDLVEDSLGYKVRLLTIEELTTKFGYSYTQFDDGVSKGYIQSEDSPSWLYNKKYYYWTMSQYNNNSFAIGAVYDFGHVRGTYVFNNENGAVRPVVTLLKSAL